MTWLGNRIAHLLTKFTHLMRTFAKRGITTLFSCDRTLETLRLTVRSNSKPKRVFVVTVTLWRKNNIYAMHVYIVCIIVALHLPSQNILNFRYHEYHLYVVGAAFAVPKFSVYVLR